MSSYLLNNPYTCADITYSIMNTNIGGIIILATTKATTDAGILPLLGGENVVNINQTHPT